MKKYFSFLLIIMLSFAFGLKVAFAESFGISSVSCASTQTDPTDSTRKYTDCTVKVKIDGFKTSSTSIDVLVNYNNKTSKSDFKVTEDPTAGLASKSSDADKFNFTFNDGLSGEFTAFTIRFYSDATLSGKDCGGTISINYNGQTYSSTSSSNSTNSANPNTGASVSIIALGVGAIACLSFIAVSGRKTKMHRI